jgi:ketosteroid isomerase-like protein
MKNTAQEEIRTKLEEYYKAFYHKDWETFGNCLEGNFNYFTDKTGMFTKNDFIDFLKKDKWQGTDYGISDLNIHVSKGNDMGFAAYKIFFKGTVDGTEHMVNAIETTVFIKEGSVWSILHSHTSNKME